MTAVVITLATVGTLVFFATLAINALGRRENEAWREHLIERTRARLDRKNKV